MRAWNRALPWLGVSGCVLYLLSLIITVALFYPLSIDIDEKPAFVKLLVDWRSSLVQGGFGSVVNVAFRIAQVCDIVGPLIGIPAFLLAGIQKVVARSGISLGIALMSLGFALAATVIVFPIALRRHYAGKMQAMEVQDDRQNVKLRKSLDRDDLSPRARQIGWKLYASHAYFTKGELLTIPDANGKWVEYSPTEGERHTHKVVEETRERLKSSSYGNLMAWGCYSVLCLLVGLLLSLDTKMESA
jgi:hypothetical protein